MSRYRVLVDKIAGRRTGVQLNLTIPEWLYQRLQTLRQDASTQAGKKLSWSDVIVPILEQTFADLADDED